MCADGYALNYSAVYNDAAYGIEISASNGEYILVEDVTPEIDEVMQFLQLLAENLVFPSNALEVFDDLL